MLEVGREEERHSIAAQIRLAGRNLDYNSILMASSSWLFLGWILFSVYITHDICLISETCQVGAREEVNGTTALQYGYPVVPNTIITFFGRGKKQ